jgi:predicted peptidase
MDCLLLAQRIQSGNMIAALERKMTLMTNTLGLLSFIVGQLLMLAVSAQARQKETGFLNRVFKSGSNSYRYQVYLPQDWNKKTKWPVILFLHGAGERGEDGLIQTEVGIGTAIRRFEDRFPCIVVFPQCRSNVWWSDPAMQALALKSLDLSLKEFNGDKRRVYLTGLSMGGYGTWQEGANHPRRFAALVPICGGVKLPVHLAALAGVTSFSQESSDPYLAVARAIGNTPVWAFHGAADPVVPVTESQKLVEALKKVGGNVRYTEYEGIGHNSWDKAYADQDLMVWLLSQKLP